MNPKLLFFCGRVFHLFFLTAFFDALFRLRFSLHFSPRLSPGSRLYIVLPGNFHSCHNKLSMSNEVCQPSWNTCGTLIAHHPTKSSSKNAIRNNICFFVLFFLDFSLHFSLCGLEALSPKLAGNFQSVFHETCCSSKTFVPTSLCRHATFKEYPEHTPRNTPN